MMIRLASLALIAAIVGTLLGEFGFRSKKLFALLSFVIIISGVIEPLSDTITRISSLSELYGVGEGAKCIVKTVGAGYLFGFVSDVCAELGETGIQKAVSLAGRIEMFLIAFPFYEKAIRLGIELLE